MSDSESLKNKIKELENELKSREDDLAHFRKELAEANKHLEKLIGQLHQELKLANKIQKKLVPTEYPNIQGVEFSTKFIPSMISGGDYFDIFEHDDRMRYGVVVASASGHAMSALLLSVLLRLTGLMEARKGAEPHKVVSQIADEIVPSISGEDKADLFYAMIDRRSFEMEYCRVGNILALHHDYSSNKINVLEPCSPALGKDFNEAFASEKIALNPRDRLIVCTQGLVDQENIEGESYGLERLLESILRAPKSGVHELRNEILVQLQKFTKGKEVTRDITVFTQEVKDRVIKLAKT